MRNTFKRYLSLLLTLCMLAAILPTGALAEDGAASDETPPASVQTAAPEPEPAAPAPAAAQPSAPSEDVDTSASTPQDTSASGTTTETSTGTTTEAASGTTTEAASGTTTEAPSGTTTDSATGTTTDSASGTTTEAPSGTTTDVPSGTTTDAPSPAYIVSLTGAPATLEAIYGCDEDELDLPESLTAVYSDDTQAKLSVRWVCISDGLGGTAYDGECENYEEARFTFEARLPEGALCAEGLTLPRVQVQLVLPEDSNISTYDEGSLVPGMPNISGVISISNSEGVLSYKFVPNEGSDGASPVSQQWFRDNVAIPGATSETYTLTMDDMKAGATISVAADLMSGDSVPAIFQGYYSIADNNTAWSYDTSTDTLTIKEDYDLKSKDFPFTDWKSVENVVIDSHVIVSGLKISISGDVTVGSRARVSGSTIKCKTLTVQENGTVDETTMIDAQHVVNNFGTIKLRLKVSVNDGGGFYDFTVNYESQNLYALLSSKASSADNIKDRLAALGDYVWTRNNSCVSPDAELELSMNGANFVAVALPTLKIEYNGAELAKDGGTRNSLPIGSTLNAVPDTSLEGFNPSDYIWRIGDATIGSGASLTIPETITVDGMLIPLALLTGNLTCTAMYGARPSTARAIRFSWSLSSIRNPRWFPPRKQKRKRCTPRRPC